MGDASLPSLLSCWDLEQSWVMQGVVAWAQLSWTSEMGYSKDISVQTGGALRIQGEGWERRST